MKKRLIILSDLWGREKSEWLINYTQILKTHFDIKYYDCCELGKIDKSDYTERKLHEQFINGGIERAVKTLIEIEKEKINILAFSIGGAIAWKYGVKSNKIDSLICISSTRLRYETIKPKGKITLYFAHNDAYKPQKEWLDSMLLQYDILKDKEHSFYREREFAEELSKRIIVDNNTLDNYSMQQIKLRSSLAKND